MDFESIEGLSDEEIETLYENNDEQIAWCVCQKTNSGLCAVRHASDSLCLRNPGARTGCSDLGLSKFAFYGSFESGTLPSAVRVYCVYNRSI